MKPEEFSAIYPHMIGWIEQTVAAHAGSARTLASQGWPRIPHYFGDELLHVAKVVVVPRLPMPPLSAMGLHQFAQFEHGDFSGITYRDTFFVKETRRQSEPLHFHELIHVVQWKRLGPERFLQAYAAGLEAFGYRESPLERMAYDAEAAFVGSPAPFDAEKRVADALRALRLI